MARYFIDWCARPQTVLVITVLAAGAVLASRNARADWPSDPTLNVPVCTAAGTQLIPVLVSDGASGAIMAWNDQRTDGGDIYAMRVLATGTVDPAWPINGTAVCAAPGTQSNCKLTSDGLGGAYAVWNDSRSGTYNIYAQHILQNGQMDPAWPAQGLVVCAAEKNQFSPVITTDGAHGAIVAWWDFRFGVNYDVYMQHIRLDGSVDPQWPVDGQAVCVAAGDQRGVRLVPDGAGGAIAVWQDQRSGPWDIYALHVLSSGTLDPIWPAAGSPICSASGNQQFPEAVPDGSGGALVTWVDYRGGATSDIYAARVLADGSADPAWPAGGRVLCSSVGDQSAPAIVQVGGGDAIIAWMDSRSGSSKDIYAQRASGPDGGMWAANGSLICSFAGDQWNPRIVADGSGGAIVTWYDYRTVFADMYAQHLQSDGAVDPGWPTDGRALSTAPSTQQEPVSLADGSGGAIVVWQDGRPGSGVLDIYAQRVQSNGQLGGTVLGVPRENPGRLALEAVHPNPWRTGSLTVRFVLSGHEPAEMELLDVAGRRQLSRKLGTLGPGRHAIDLHSGRTLANGVYFVRLREGSETSTTRVAVLGH